jgi:hypothetical protein
VRAIQCTQFCAKNAKNDLDPTYLVKRNFCFETEGVHDSMETIIRGSGFGIGYVLVDEKR